MKAGIIGLIVFIFTLSSCSMVKNPQSANFQRVKYNSHIKMAKKQAKEEVQENLAQTEIVKDVNSYATEMEPSKINKLKRKPQFAFNEVMTESPKQKDLMHSELSASNQVYNMTNQSDEFLWTPIDGWKNTRPVEAKVPEMTLDGGSADWGNLLYLLLVVILILIVISLIANLAGGLIGALIAVLLILLILRFLGYI